VAGRGNLGVKNMKDLKQNSDEQALKRCHKLQTTFMCEKNMQQVPFFRCTEDGITNAWLSLGVEYFCHQNM